jgi:molybdopterin-containing oxidoreductase family iron-sulfur binding subunit
MTSLVWENAALVAPALAARLGVRNGDVLDLALGGRSLRAPVRVQPGQPEGSVTLHLGHGRTRGGPVAVGRGFDAGLLRPKGASFFASGLEARPTGERVDLASTQGHHQMMGRDLVRTAPLAVLRGDPEVFHRHGDETHPTLYPERPPGDHAWAMAIDLTTCTGCAACVVACQAENTIPTVGRTEVLRGREMHWIRVDRYYEGPLDDPIALHQPVPCMQCENAPCEVVCPTNATVHSSEGLNDMTYNRCIGTRYCSNNCPYKVRRFNFFEYADHGTPALALGRNPDVSVRVRGVMEKCTYCVQRIQEARIAAGREGRPMRDGDVVPACAQVCPAEAITFGDLRDPESRVSRLRSDPRTYALLGGLHTRPRTTYLGRVRNPNPDLSPEGGG